MLDRRVPASLLWLGLLAALTVGAAVIGGAFIYAETQRAARTQAEASTRGHVDAGQVAIARYGCGACHVIPGIHGANGKVGPDLTHLSLRTEIAGTLPNDPDAMVRWLMHPQRIVPGNGMPEMGVSETDARDLTAYLYAQK